VSRDNFVYKEKYNGSLDFLATLEPSAALPAETELAEKWQISRTTVRAILDHLNDSNIIEWKGRRKTVLRHPEPADYFKEDETISPAQKVETAFMEYVLGGDLAPGTILHESELVREFKVSSSAIREFMIRFSRFGLIEKKKNRHWVLNGFTREFAMELFDVRERFELWAFDALLNNLEQANIQSTIKELISDHDDLYSRIDTDYLQFSRLDEKMHTAFADNLGNRFVNDFHELVALVFYFHYRWNKFDESERNKAAVQQHLDVLNKLKVGDKRAARESFKEHLNSARQTLLASVTWDKSE